MRTRHDAGNERGSAVVEFALVLPLVLTVILGIVEVGLAVRDRQLIEAAARAGARAAAVQPDPAAVTSAALAAAPGLDAADVTVTVLRAGSRGDPVTVDVTYVHDVRVPLVGWLFSDGYTMATSTTVRQEFT